MKATASSITDWQHAVVTSDLSHQAVRVCVLLSLSGMKPNGVVSVPRATLAANLDCTESRIREGIDRALDAGLLTRLRKGTPGRCASYQALIPKGAAKGTAIGPLNGPFETGSAGSKGAAHRPPNARASQDATAENTTHERDLRSVKLTSKQQRQEAV